MFELFKNPLAFLWLGIAMLIGAIIAAIIVTTIRKNRDIRLKHTADDIIAAATEEAR